MKKLQIKTNPKIEAVFANYPDLVREKMNYLRALVLQTAEETADIFHLEETLKWGEPSFLCKNGSTLRMDWKKKTPNQYALYFQCSTRLVETFKTVFGAQFEYEGNRAIVFQLDQEIPKEEIKACIKATLNYHEVKQLITLGL